MSTHVLMHRGIPWSPPEPRSAIADLQRRIAYEEDAKILFGKSVLITGIPGPHARSRMAAVQRENALRERIILYMKRRPV